MWRNENKGKRRKEKKEVRKMEEDKNTLDLHTEVREEDRVAKAVALFKEGYNCSQSVVTAFADLYGFTREQALHMSASFGGGIGRMRPCARMVEEAARIWSEHLEKQKK